MAYYADSDTQRANMRYIRSAMHEPMLEREHELDLARRWRDHKDERALHELISAYRRLVVSIASKFKNYGLPMGDLIQEGNIGLMRAASRFEPELGNRFSTYAAWWVKAQIQDYVLRNWSIVRAGTTAAQKSLFFNLHRLRAKIAEQPPGEYMNEDSLDSIAKHLKVSTREVSEMEARLGGDWSLNSPIGEAGEWQDILADSRPTPEEVVMRRKDSASRTRWLKEALSTLNERERIIIEKRHVSEQTVTLEHLGKELGISKERVRQLEHKALGKLKSSLLDKIKQTDLT